MASAISAIVDKHSRNIWVTPVILACISALFSSCTISEPENHKIQNIPIEAPGVDTVITVINAFLFKDSTELQILTKELKDSEKCHSCSAPIILRRSYKSRDGKITWKESEIDATNQWGKVGHFYVEELEDCSELLFFKGTYSQSGFIHTWIDAYRTESFTLGRKEWTFDFMEGKDQTALLSLDSLALLEEFTSQGVTPVESRLITEGTVEVNIEPGILNLETTEKEYFTVWIKEDERSIYLTPKTKSMSLYYKLEYGKVYLDSVWQSNKQHFKR